MRTLLELLPAMAELGEREAILYDDGLRVRRLAYRELHGRIAALARRWDDRGLAPGDRLLLWGENRPEWTVVFWAALARRITVVPVDFRSSPALVERIQSQAGAKLLVHGAEVPVSDLDGAPDLPRLAFEEIFADEYEEAGTSLELAGAEPDDVVQILFTSGTTGEPRGVVHRHRHLVPNLAPIRREIEKFAIYLRPFQPIRMLELLPLSHVFGQFTGLYLPPCLGGSVVFLGERHPAAIIETLRRERVSVLIAVPRFLRSLREELERRFEVGGEPATRGGLAAGLARWWKHRDVHSALGWKFWAIVSAASRLPEEEEAFWWSLGFPLVQGYGLTETSSLVSTNHPLRPRRGSLGKVVGNQRVRLAEDGEILVRGENVSEELMGGSAADEARFVTLDGERWLRTGDLGDIAEDGTLYFRGRKKDVIIGAEGLNVYPEDVEKELARAPEIEEAVVVGRDTLSGERVHAVLRLRSSETDPAPLVAAANARLEPHQRVREWTVWPGEDFPRTPSTLKIRRHEVRERVANGLSVEKDDAVPAPSGVRDMVAAQLGMEGGDIDADRRLQEELGLSSLDRVELLSRLQEHYRVALDERDMADAKTLGELESWVERSRTSPTRESREGPSRRKRSPLRGLPRHARSRPARLFRDAFREIVTLPLFRHYLPLAVEGGVEGVRPPVLFAPNHNSSLDTVALLAALPLAWRTRLAPAISQDHFLPYLEATGSVAARLSLAVQYGLANLLFGAFPLAQSTAGVGEALRFAGRLVDEGHSILIFPEGRRSPDGRLHAFRPGVGLLAVRLQIPVVPVHLEGLYEVMPLHRSWPEPGPVRVRFGEPLRFRETDDAPDAASRIQRAVERLAAEAPRRGEAG